MSPYRRLDAFERVLEVDILPLVSDRVRKVAVLVVRVGASIVPSKRVPS